MSYDKYGHYTVGVDPAQGNDENAYVICQFLNPKLQEVKKKTMKYFKVIKENFLWEVGAILKPTSNGNGYEPADEVFKKHEGGEYITSHIVENSPDYFERVYKVDLATRVVYETKEKAKELIAKIYKPED